MERKITMDLIEQYAPCELIRFSLQWRPRVEWVTDATCRLLGYSKPALLADGGMLMQQLIPEPEYRQLLSNIALYDAGSSNYSGPCHFRRQDGSLIALYFRGGLLPRDDGSDSIIANLQPLQEPKKNEP